MINDEINESEVPDYLYHATTEHNWNYIKDEGLVPAFPAVYMTDDIKAAEWFAHITEGHEALEGKKRKSVIIKVKAKSLDRAKLGTAHELLCDILHTTDFWHYYDKIPPSELSLVKKHGK